LRNPTKKKRRKFPIRNFLSALLFVLSAGLLLSPIVVNFYVSQKTATLAKSYKQDVSNLSPDEIKQQTAEAENYNAEIYNKYIYDASQHVAWTGKIPDYKQILNIGQNGMMGFLEIPQIQLKNVPIYHGVDEKTLEGGIGHIPQTSLPIGGINTHAVLSAHSGRVNDALFTDLDKLKNGDYFLIHVLNKTLKYKVDNIKIVDPSDTSSLGVVKDRDLVTLITCWPTGINNKRLLVTGYRVPYTAPTGQERAQRNTFGYNFWVLSGLSLLLALLILYWLWLFIGGRKRLYFAADREIRELTMRDGQLTGDFGAGLYLSNRKKLAEDWLSALTEAGKADDARINVYRFVKQKELTRLSFASRSDTWSRFIANNESLPAAKENDVLIGPPQVKTDKKTEQFVFKTEKSLKHLKFKKSYRPKSKK
jgi:sortase A